MGSLIFFERAFNTLLITDTPIFLGFKYVTEMKFLFLMNQPAAALALVLTLKFTSDLKLYITAHGHVI